MGLRVWIRLRSQQPRQPVTAGGATASGACRRCNARGGGAAVLLARCPLTPGGGSAGGAGSGEDPAGHHAAGDVAAAPERELLSGSEVVACVAAETIMVMRRWRRPGDGASPLVVTSALNSLLRWVSRWRARTTMRQSGPGSTVPGPSCGTRVTRAWYLQRLAAVVLRAARCCGGRPGRPGAAVAGSGRGRHGGEGQRPRGGGGPHGGCPGAADERQPGRGAQPQTGHRVHAEGEDDGRRLRPVAGMPGRAQPPHGGPGGQDRDQRGGRRPQGNGRGGDRRAGRGRDGGAGDAQQPGGGDGADGRGAHGNPVRCGRIGGSGAVSQQPGQHQDRDGEPGGDAGQPRGQPGRSRQLGPEQAARPARTPSR